MFKGRLISPYQHTGVRWLVERETVFGDNRGGFLCDEMGLGKTVQMIATMCANLVQKTLIIVPKSIVSQWADEIKAFAPTFAVSKFDSSRKELPGFLNPTIVIAPYSALIQRKGKPQSALLGVRWDRVILDEAHEIRNRKSITYNTAMQLRAPIRWVLTGTPIFNSLKDFVSLGTFIGLNKLAIEMHPQLFREKYVMRRTKQDVAEFNARLELPPADFQDIELEMYPEEKELYKAVFDNARGVAREHHVSKGLHMMALLEAFLRTRQVLTWPQMYFDGMARKEENAGVEFAPWTGRSNKLETLIKYIMEHRKEKALVFCQIIGEMNQIQNMLAEQNIETFRIDGSVDKDDREARIKAFKASSKAPVFLIQIKSGGVGLNLQVATRVYITSPSWNPATELQAIGRSHRTGQTQKVFIKRLIYAGDEQLPSVEQSILELQDKKNRICAEVLNDQRILSQLPKKKSNVTFYDLKRIFKV